MESELKQLDDLCMRFEDEWAANQPLSFPFRFFQTESQAFQNPGRVLLELCQIDMQRRWQAWNAKELGGMSVQEVTAKFSRIPRVKDYLSMANDKGLELNRLETTELKSCEFVARQKYGDLPSPVEADIEVRTAPLATLKRPVATISRSGEPIYRQPIWGQLKVGRQAKGEPAYPDLCEKEVPGKLICAEGTDASISRDQFLVTLVSSRFATVNNTSHNRCFRIDHHRVFEPGAEQILKFPFSVELGHTIVCFQRPE